MLCYTELKNGNNNDKREVRIMQKSNKIILFISIGILATIGVVIGVSYAWWRFTAIQTTVNKIDSACLDLEITNEVDEIELHNAFPIRDSEASSLTPYTFTITNTCNLDIAYDVNLEVMDVTERLASEYVDVSVDGNAKIRLGGESTAAVTYDDDYTAIEAYKVTSGVLKAGDSVNHAIRLWIDEAVTTADDVMNKNFVSKITVFGTQLDVTSLTTFSDYLIALSNSDSNIIQETHEATDQTENNAITDYRYVGKDPNNYVCLEESGSCTEDQLFRIIGVIPTQSSENGPYENRVKLIKATSYGNYLWSGNSDNSSNDWTKSTLNTTILNQTYWNSISSYQKYIEDTKWYLGGISSDSSSMQTSIFYKNERGESVYNGNPTSTVSKIGLMYPSDYGYATSGGSTTNRNTCLTTSLYSWNGSEVTDCYTNDWLYLFEAQWTITPSSSSIDGSVYVAGESMVFNGYVDGDQLPIRPVYQLKSNVRYQRGDGSKNTPYQIEIGY